MIITIATPEEYVLLPELVPKNILKDSRVIITGVGAMNVIAALDGIDRDTRILNVGYAGSNTLEKGKAYQVSMAAMHHPTADYEEIRPKISVLAEDENAYPCYTSSDFVEKTNITHPALFDMELAIIAAMGFYEVYSIKMVSDNLSLEEYEEVTDGK